MEFCWNCHYNHTKHCNASLVLDGLLVSCILPMNKKFIKKKILFKFKKSVVNNKRQNTVKSICDAECYSIFGHLLDWLIVKIVNILSIKPRLLYIPLSLYDHLVAPFKTSRSWYVKWNLQNSKILFNTVHDAYNVNKIIYTAILRWVIFYQL